MEEEMRTKRVNRFFCDHCNRGSLRSDTMRRHEAACFRNPDRRCPICANAALEQKPMTALKAAFPDPADLQPLRDLTEGCPACILSTIIQVRHMTTIYVGEHGESEEDVPEMITFNYKEEMAAFNAEPGRTNLCMLY